MSDDSKKEEKQICNELIDKYPDLVNYKTGEIHDMERITRKAHEHGALIIWDLAHSLGALPVDLNSCNADFAIGCTYKYLNSGHGGPAYLFVAERHLKQASNTLTGWQGHANPFSFDINYEPAETIEKFRCGSPAILSYLALEKSLDIETITQNMILDDTKNCPVCRKYVNNIHPHNVSIIAKFRSYLEIRL